MTNEEAIKVLHKCAKGFEVKSASFMAITALEKQIPRGIPMASDSNSRGGYTDTFICPSCGTYIQMPYLQRECEYSYCPYCGQKWED